MRNILTLNHGHLDGVHLIESLCFSEPWSQKSLEMLCDGNNFGIVALIDGQVAAYGGMLCVLDEGSVTNIATHPDHRRKGLGREVLRAMLTEARNRGISTVFLEVRESNLAARSLYLSEGFEICGVRKNFYSHPVENALQMIYDIN